MYRVLFLTGSNPAHVVGGGGTAARSIIDALRAPPLAAHVIVECTNNQDPFWPRRLRQAGAVMRSLISPFSSKSLFDLPRRAMPRICRAMEKPDVDLVVFNGSETYPCVAHLPQGRNALLVAHNDEAKLYTAQLDKLCRLPLIGAFVRRDLAKFVRLDHEVVSSIGSAVCLSNEDEKALTEKVPQLETLVLHPSFSCPQYEPSTSRSLRRPLTLGFLAKYSWWPNVEAVNWLADHVLDYLAPQSVKLLLFGPGAEIFQGRHPLIIPRGYVPDLSQVWEESDLIVCPMVSGSGVNIKFIEALYHRRPILATSFTQRGIASIDDPAVRLLDKPEDWVSFLESDDALQLAQMRPRLSTANRFSQQAAAGKLADFLLAR